MQQDWHWNKIVSPLKNLKSNLGTKEVGRDFRDSISTASDLILIGKDVFKWVIFNIRETEFFRVSNLNLYLWLYKSFQSCTQNLHLPAANAELLFLFSREIFIRICSHECRTLPDNFSVKLDNSYEWKSNFLFLSISNRVGDKTVNCVTLNACEHNFG